MATSVERRTG